MGSRKQIPPEIEGRPLPASGLFRHGALPDGHRPAGALPPQVLEDRLAFQAAEIQQLVEDNRRLAATHVAMRQDVAAAQNEVKKLSDHIRRLRAGSDMEIQSMLEKIKRMELEVKAGEDMKKELRQAHVEARSLALERQELTSKIQVATRELDKARADVKRLPEIHAELDSLRQEHERLRVTFEYEKGLNIKKVEQMRAVEKNIVGMAGEVERLRMEVADAENRANAPQPYSGHYISPAGLYPPAMHGSMVYADNFPRPPLQMDTGMFANNYTMPPLQTDTGTLPQGMTPYVSSSLAVPPDGSGNAAISGEFPSLAGTYDGSHGRR